MLMHYGIGNREALTTAEIADELGVKEATVKSYLKESPVSNAMRARLEDVAEQELRMMIQDLQDRMQKLREMESTLMDSVEVVITDYDSTTIEGTLSSYKAEEYELEDIDATIEQDIALPSEWKQVPSFKRLQAVWDEQRKTQDQLTKLLGLQQPEQIELSGEVTERKLWAIDASDDPLPEQDVEPIDVDSEIEDVDD